MKQTSFEQDHGAQWQAFAARLEQLENAKRGAKAGLELDDADFPAAYRRLCQHLALAKERHYSSRLVERLSALALRAYQQIYRAPGGRLSALKVFLLADFPRLVRREARWFFLCSVLFYLPLCAMAYATYDSSELIYSLLPATAVAQLEEMYGPDSANSNRAAHDNVVMLGYYIYNNIGIGFRTFAAGILLGVGSAFVLLFNGIVIGAVTGYLSQQGYAAAFYPFVIGHSAFELTGIVLSGVAGLKLGWALLAPGPYRRLQALRLAAKDSVKIVYGVVALLLIAAFIEAFWSSQQALPATVKYAVGGACWLLVACYLLFAGRHATR